jgi:DNA ligase 1
VPQGVFQQLKEIARVEGHKSQDAKVRMINKLLAGAKDTESAFIVRSLQGKLRIGLAEQSVLVALAHAMALQVLTALHVLCQAALGASHSSECCP